MKVNISADENHEHYCSDKQLQGSLPVGAVIKNTRIVTYKKDTDYERVCLLIDFDYDYPIDLDISNFRTLTIVLIHGIGFKGSLITACARIGDPIRDTDALPDKRIDATVEIGAVVDRVKFDKRILGGHFRKNIHLEHYCEERLLIDYHYSTLNKTLAIKLKSSEDYKDQIVWSYTQF